MVYTGFCCDALLFQWNVVVKQIQFFGGADVQDVQPCTGFLARSTAKEDER